MCHLNNNTNSNHNKTPSTITKIRDITIDSESVVVIGKILYDSDLHEFASGTTYVSFRITDGTGSICCKKYFKYDKKADAQFFNYQLKADIPVKIAGSPEYDDYQKETVLFINKMEIMDKKLYPAPLKSEIQAPRETTPAVFKDATQQLLLKKLGEFAGVGKQELIQAILDLRQKKFEREQAQFKELLS